MVRGELDADTVRAMGRSTPVWTVACGMDGSHVEKPMGAGEITARMMVGSDGALTMRAWRMGYVRTLPYALVSDVGRVTCVRMPEYDDGADVWRLDTLTGVRMLVPASRLVRVVAGMPRTDGGAGGLRFPAGDA